MWRERITGYCPSASFFPGCANEVLDAAERELGTGLPPDLRAVLTESDGVIGEHGLRGLWPIARIVETNRLFRANPNFRDLHLPLGHLLFFSDAAGTGDQFGFAMQSETIWRPDIFVWDHTSDSRIWVGPSLEPYFRWWLSVPTLR